MGRHRGFFVFDIMFLDELDIFVQAGRGGSGCVSFRREKYVAFGGPNGGDGGDGGSVYLVVKPEYNTLLPLRNRRQYRAGRGQHGRGSDMTGARGEDLTLEAPPGTIVRDRDTGAILGDLTKPGDRVTAAQGGRGGKGNRHFASATMRAPKFAQPGEPGEERWLRLELKMLADVGLVGFPNAGKSTLISRLSAARPKVADYPFTTLIPNLGVIEAAPFKTFVAADIPGIIEGAHEGAGLGLRFLKHIERTSVLLMLIDPTDPERNAWDAYHALRTELRSFSRRLSEKETMVAFTKADAWSESDQSMGRLTALLDREGAPWRVISAVRGDNLKDLAYDLYQLVADVKKRRPADEPDQPADDAETAEPAAGPRDPLDEL